MVALLSLKALGLALKAFFLVSGEAKLRMEKLS